MVQSYTPVRVYAKEAIKLIGLAASVTGSFVAPNSLILTDMLMKHMDSKSAKKTVSYLKYRKLIEVKARRDGSLDCRLTGRGQKRYIKLEFDALTIKTPRSWDGKWRLVLFDIPTSRNNHRRVFASKLAELGLYMLQKSCWIHPFDSQNEIGFLIDQLGLDKFVSYLVVESGNFTDHAEAHFKKAKLLI